MTDGIVLHHDLWLVCISAVLCAAGSWAVARFFQRMVHLGDAQRYGWLFLTALASGVTIWCTHFVAMLGYDPGVPMSFSWPLTALSLVIAMGGSALGFLIAGRAEPARSHPAVGGIILGLSVAAMHYVGMSAIRMPRSMSWNLPLVSLSVVLGVAASALALCAGRSSLRHAANLMAALFVASVLILHYTGMAAMRLGDTMTGMSMGDTGDPSAQYALGIAVAAMSFVTLGAGFVGYLIDIQSRAASLERFRKLAMYDVLTSLPNRASLNERLDREIERSSRLGVPLALVVIDVDNFKEINDLHGHPVGDLVLRTLGAGMEVLARDDAFVARIGGDEFVALCRLEDGRELTGFLDDLRRIIARPIPAGAHTIVPRASIGAAVFPTDAADAETLVNNADLAMYRAKGDPLQDLCLYDATVDERTRVRRGLAADLRDALARDEFFVVYQVQTAVSTGEPCAYEALLRWRHPQLGLVSPADFVPLAEDSGLIVTIGAWVLRTACAAAVRWDPPYRVSVNVSAVQLSEPGLADTVREALAQTGLPAERLELEMTETAVFTDREQALRTVLEIKELGVGIALDDFGVGYSSLDALRSFPIDRIKIDRSFFSGSGTPHQTVELVHAVISLGRTFGMSVLAEGIETDAQLALLNEAGCDEAQGFLFGRPSAVEEIVASGQLKPMSAG